MKQKTIVNSQFSIFKFRAAVVISIVCALSCANAKVLPDTARLIPAETVLLVNIEDFSQLKQQFEKTNIYKLYKDPSMAGFVSALEAKQKAKIRETNNEIAKAIVDAEILPEGRIAFALVLNKQIKDKELPILFITQWGKNLPKIKEAVEKTVQKVIEAGSHRKTEDYRGVSIVTLITERSPVQVKDWRNYTPESNNAPMKTVQPAPAKTSYCFIDDYLIGSDDIEVLKFTIAHIKGASGSTLADDADYTATIAALGPYRDIYLHVNIKQIIKTIIAEDTTGQVQTTTANLGFDNVVSFGSSIGFSRRAGSSCNGKAFLRINGSKKGVCKMLDIESSALRIPRFIPASVYSVTVCNLNIKKFYDELYNILYNFNPMAVAWMYTPILPPSPDGQPGLQLKTDIIDHLGSQIAIAQSINKPISISSSPTETIIALATSNRDALEKSLSLFHNKLLAMNNPDAKRELLGHTIYLVDPRFFPFWGPGRVPMQTSLEADTRQMPKPAFTVTDTHLILGTEPSIEQAIRTLSSKGAVSVESAKWFVSAKQVVPSIVGVVSLQDNAASGEFFWQIIKEAVGKAKASTMSIGPNPASIFTELGVNAGLLPPFDSVKKYFGPSTSYGTSRPEGFFFEFNYLNSTDSD